MFKEGKMGIDLSAAELAMLLEWGSFVDDGYGYTYKEDALCDKLTNALEKALKAENPAKD
jgi:hypothetical protein